jgi:serine/threonine-protein kinase
MGITSEMKLFNSKVLDERYEIVHEIKKGGFGIVYYGLDRKLNKPVAIKEIAPDLLEDPKYLDMFQEEALNIAKLSHNNIVHIYELKKTADGRLFIIMEYIDGIDLEKIIRRARKLGYKFPSHLATYIVAEICMALDYAHHRRDAFTNKPLNLVHQDISPSNIMISRYGGIKLIDFGIASVRKHQTKENRDNKLRGKIPYMAPEQLIMGNHPDHRSDLFSLGLVLYETLTGQRLFNSHEEVIAAGRNSKWFKKAVKGKRIASPLEKILAKALEIDLSKRYQSANHMYIDLLQYLISCNETGELMDHLADFVTDIFLNETSSNSNNNNKTDIVEEILEIEEDSQQHVSNRAISEEWQAEMQSNPHESLTLEEPQPSSTQAHGITHAEDFSTIELDDEEEDLKTVIDVLRISARNNKKRIIKTIAGVFTAVILLGVFDTIYGWTQVGTWIFDWLFPPAIEIVTVPPNAQVSLDGKEIKGQTPISIDKISPGVHRLSLSLAGYKPIVKSLFVPREGAVHVQGESENEKNRSYLFRFNTEIEIDSFPPEALVYINGIRFNQKTPCTISWEVGSPLTIEMELEGFERLSGFSLDTKEGYEEVEDHRFWQMSVINEPHIKYAVNGIFRKRVIIESIPDGAEIVTTENNEAIGVTGRDNSILLAAGAQELILRKRNFLPKRLTLNIDQNFDKKITAVLSRKVRFRAFDELNLQGDDINAYLVSLKNRGTNILKGRRTTPFEITLPAYTYTAEFEKKGYQKTQATVGPFVQQVQVEMEPSKAVVEIKVIDGLSSQPIADAEIFYNFTNRPRPYESYFDRTDENGEGFGELMKGDYLFTVKRSGYNSSNKNISAQPGETHKFVFRIYPSN